MKICQFFLSVLFGIIYGRSLVTIKKGKNSILAPLNKILLEQTDTEFQNLFKHPNEFVDTFANSDPEQIQSIIQILEDLLAKKKNQINLEEEEAKKKNETLINKTLTYNNLVNQEIDVLGEIVEHQEMLKDLLEEQRMVDVKIDIAVEIAERAQEVIPPLEDIKKENETRVDFNEQILLEMRKILTAEIQVLQSKPNDTISDLASEKDSRVIVDEILELVDDCLGDVIAEKKIFDTSITLAENHLNETEVVVNLTKADKENILEQTSEYEKKITNLQLLSEDLKQQKVQSRTQKERSQVEFQNAQKNLEEATQTNVEGIQTLEKVISLLRNLLPSSQ